MESARKKRIYLLYSVIFFVFASSILILYYSKGKSLTNGGDDYRQAYKALIYYSRFLREILDNIFVKHQFIIPQWDFNIGEGSDIFHAFNTGMIGDPFCFFCFLFSEDNMYVFYDIMRLLRLYFSGLSFICLCNYFNKNNVFAVVSGALSYSFCSASFNSLLSYPFMNTPMVFFPLVIIGVEKVLRNENPLFLVISVALSSISNFYFFYSVVILTIIYFLVRVLVQKLKIKEILHKTVCVAGWSLFGIALSAIVVLPIAYSFIGFGRLDMEYPIHLLYSKQFYTYMIPEFTLQTVNSYSAIGGFAFPCIITFVYLFNERNNKTLIYLSVLGLVLISFPMFGQVFNGFSYPSTRWVRLLSLLICYINVENFEKISELGKRKYHYIGILFVYFALCVLIDKENYKLFILFFILATSLLLFINHFNTKKMYVYLSLLFSTIFTIFLSIYLNLSPNYWNMIEDGVDINDLSFASNKEVDVISTIDDDGFWRYSGNNLNDNENILGTRSSTNFYWSVSNNNVIDLRKLIGMSDHNCFHYTDYNNKSALMSLASIKYFLTNNGDNNIPYQYEYYKSYKDYDVYVNSNPLPLIYGFDTCISRNEWNELDTIKKQEALTQSVVLDEIENSSNNNIYLSQKIDYTIIENNGFEISNNKIIVKNDNSKLLLKCHYSGQGEYYLVIDNLRWISDKQLTWQDHLYTNIVVECNGNKNIIYYKNPDHTRYSNRHLFSINLGYLNDDITHLSLTFPDSGEFNYDSFQIVHLPLDNQSNNIEKLKDINIQNILFDTNIVKTKLSVDKNKYVVFSIPYSTGWKAYVNGKEMDLIKANIQYMGLQLQAGNYEIVLKYRTPLLREGAIISTISMMSLIIYLIYKKKKNKKEIYNNKG